MRPPSFQLTVCLWALLTACKPDLGAPASAINGVRILAVRGTPPEVAPGGKDAGVVYDLLAVTPQGTLPPRSDVWSYCLAPHPPAENNVVSNACLGSDDIQAVGPNGATVFGVVPPHGCSIYGPNTPAATPDAAAARPPDPDITGGFYQPVRVELPLPDGGTITAFGEERISCGIGAVPLAVQVQYAHSYEPNKNPVLSGALAAVGSAAAQSLTAPDAGSPLTLPPGATVTLTANWPAASAETFPTLDPVSRLLVTETETLTASFFATGGAVALDEVSVPPDGGSSAVDQWTTPTTTGPVHLWVVLRDDRGGVTWAEYLVQVGG